ncbi:Phyllocladan-16-alpha-ol synthase [Diaporthe australafricana]|uniref:Phyllocladan-16-alpha-ol synthase n=1 Tax=Diaporthe australafricana TaxID=127596 RepID=A0ABR3VVH0_9PEZI
MALHKIDHDEQLRSQAVSLVRQSGRGYDSKYAHGSMSCAAYDTAWVSLVTKPVNGARQWLFPESFRFLLDHQESDGSWGRQLSAIDKILNTAAALTSLTRHAKEPLQLIDMTEGRNLDEKIGFATQSLQHQLSEWDIANTTHVGFEVIVPALLDLLAGEGIAFSFKARDEMIKSRAAKLKHFDPRLILYGKQQSTLLHSLEAFTGRIDYDKLAHHKVNGSFMASPSSTAAYLMNVSSWDDEAEDYLRHVVTRGPGCGQGSVPSAYPSSNFEFSWILSTLLHAGFTTEDMDCPELQEMAEILEDSFLRGQGTIGFAPFIESDADDTAKGLFVLNKLGSQRSVDAMVQRFEVKGHFQTYPAERDASFSANCNVLSALLLHKEVGTYQAQIYKCVRFLTRCWWNTDGPIRDKWNQSHLYSNMLMVQALTDFLATLDQGVWPSYMDEVEGAKITVCLFQACLRTLLGQHEDGSWSQSQEQTAYAVLTLTQARRLSFCRYLQPQIHSAIEKAVAFILSRGSSSIEISDPPSEFLWTEKVSYASPLLTEAYRVAALKSAGSITKDNGNVGYSIVHEIDANRMKQHVRLFHQTPLFKSLPEWQLRASFIEGHLFLPIVNEHRLDVFPRKNMDPDDDYIGLIPFTWTASSNKDSTFASPAWLYAMMMVSVVDYQADEFMEAVAGLEFANDLPGLVNLIQEVLAPYKTEPASPTTSLLGQSDNSRRSLASEHSDTDKVEEVKTCLRRFVSFFLDYPAVRNAHEDDRATAWREVHNYLVAHVRHTADNVRLNSQEQRRWYVSRKMPYFHWIRSNDDIACPITFGFVTCLVPYLVGNHKVERAVINTQCETSAAIANSDASFDSVEAKYYADDLCRHITNVTRIYNDCGSIARDAAEKNLNSVNFPEFAITAAGSDRLALHALGEYERTCCQVAFAQLETASLQTAATSAERTRKRRRLDVWQVFLNTADLYGQIYVIRDFTARSVHVRDTNIHSTTTTKDPPSIVIQTAVMGRGAVLAT